MSFNINILPLHSSFQKVRMYIIDIYKYICVQRMCPLQWSYWTYLILRRVTLSCYWFSKLSRVRNLPLMPWNESCSSGPWDIINRGISLSFGHCNPFVKIYLSEMDPNVKYLVFLGWYHAKKTSLSCYFFFLFSLLSILDQEFHIHERKNTGKKKEYTFFSFFIYINSYFLFLSCIFLFVYGFYFSQGTPEQKTLTQDGATVLAEQVYSFKLWMLWQVTNSLIQEYITENAWFNEKLGC